MNILETINELGKKAKAASIKIRILKPVKRPLKKLKKALILLLLSQRIQK